MGVDSIYIKRCDSERTRLHNDVTHIHIIRLKFELDDPNAVTIKYSSRGRSGGGGFGG